MSWGASFIVKSGATPETIDFSDTANVEEVPEHLEQYREAVSAAFGVLLSGVVGDGGKDYKVVLSGHANEGHEPADGWASDCVTINIFQLDEV